MAERGTTVYQDLIITGDLAVSGTTTTVDTTNLLIDDKEIVISNVETPDESTANGAGLTIKGLPANGDKTFHWDSNTTQFQSSELIGTHEGTSSTPAWSFTGDPDTGLYSAAPNVVGVSVGANSALTVSDGTVTFFDGAMQVTTRGTLPIQANTNPYILARVDTADNGVYRVMAWLTAVNNGVVLDFYADLSIVRVGPTLTLTNNMSNIDVAFTVQSYTIGGRNRLVFTLAGDDTYAQEFQAKIVIMPTTSGVDFSGVTVTNPLTDLTA